MALTNGEELLVDLLKMAGLTEDETIVTMMILKTKEERTKLLLWLYRNRGKVTQQDTLKIITDIRAKKI